MDISCPYLAKFEFHDVDHFGPNGICQRNQLVGKKIFQIHFLEFCEERTEFQRELSRDMRVNIYTSSVLQK